MAKAKKDIAKAESHVLAEAPSYLDQDSTRGQENVGIDDLTIPRLSVIQDLSPQRKKNDPEYIKGAEEGMLFNTVTNELYGTDVNFVPCYFRKEWVIWKLQAAGGGFEGSFDTEAEAIAEFEAQGYVDDTCKIPGSTEKVCAHEIIDMGQHFGLIAHLNGKLEEIVISMSKSKMKVSRQFNTIVKMAGGDRFSRVYKIGVVEDENSAGQSYYNLAGAALGVVPEPIYRAAEKMYESIADGTKDVERKAD